MSKPPPSSIQIFPATEADLDRLMSIRIRSFAAFPVEAILNTSIDTPETRRVIGAKHLFAWDHHRASFPEGMFPMKAVHVSQDGEEEIVGFAEWYIYTHPQSTDMAAATTPHPLRDPARFPTEKQAYAQAWLGKCTDAEVNFTKGRPHALLMYMCVDEKWRRQGVSTACVRWGMEKCRELGLPGYLEASKEGKMVYEKLGWEVVGEVRCGGGEFGEEVVFPNMVYWPEGVERWED